MQNLEALRNILRSRIEQLKKQLTLKQEELDDLKKLTERVTSHQAKVQTESPQSAPLILSSKLETSRESDEKKRQGQIDSLGKRLKQLESDRVPSNEDEIEKVKIEIDFREKMKGNEEALNFLDAIFSDDKSKLASDQKYILFTCNVRGDGIGDLGHFVDVTKGILETKEFRESGMTPLFILTGSHVGGQDRTEIFKAALRSRGIDPDSNNVHISRFGEELSKSAEWLEKLLKTQAAFNISTPDNDMNLDFSREIGILLRKMVILKNQTIPFTTILEHGENALKVYRDFGKNYNDYEKKVSLAIGMDIIPHGRGLLLRRPERKLTPAEALLSLDNKGLLDILLRGEKRETPRTTPYTKEETEAFFKKSLLIPGYFQDLSSATTSIAARTLITTVNSIASSELAVGKDEIVLVVNPQSLFNNKKLYSELFTDNVSEITIYSPGQEKPETIVNPNPKIETGTGTNPRLKIKILAGFRPNDRDFDILHQCAHFGGASGDKSFEQILSNDLIPMLQIREWKIPIIKHLIEHTKNLLGDPNAVALYFEALLRLSALVDESHNTARKLVMAEILDEGRNQNSETKSRLAKTVGERLKKLKIMSSPIDTLNKEDIANLRSMSQEISGLLTNEFKKQWKVVLDDLHRNHNLYNELPSIVKATLDMAQPKERQAYGL